MSEVALLARILALEGRLSALENLFGVGPHTLVAKDGRMAFCGGPGHCQACDYPTKIWPGNEWERRLDELRDEERVRSVKRHFIPDYGSEGEY